MLALKVPRADPQQRDLVLQTPTTFLERSRCGQASEVDFVDDGEHEDLEQHDVDLGTLGHNAQPVTVGRHRDVALLKAEDPQEVDEVGLHVPQAAQVLQLFLGEAQRAQVLDLSLDFVPGFAQWVGGLVAAHKTVLGLVGRH